MSKTQRNIAIAAAYRGGAVMTVLAKQHGLSLTRISHIVWEMSAELDPAELRLRLGRSSRRNASAPAARAKISAAIRQRWADGLMSGRPTLFAYDTAKRGDYLALRRAYGAAYARDAMGLS